MLYLHLKAKKEMLADLVTAFPHEGCGFLFGEENGPERIITMIQPVNNSKEGDKRRRFEIAPVDYMKAERLAYEKGVQLLGVYHSHPNHPAVPSEHDRVAAQPYFSYVIVSVLDGVPATVRSWRLNDEEQFEQETILEHSLLLNPQ